jgi:glycosyltransferase involved in cell wall biosynthesis
MKKINIICLHLGYCGIEKAITSLANFLSIKNDVTVVCVYKLYNNPIFGFNDNVKVNYLINNDKVLKLSNYNKLISKFDFISLFNTLRKDYVNKNKFISLFKDIFYVLYIKLYKKNKILLNYIKNTYANVIITTLDYKLISKNVSDNVIKIGWEHNYHNYNKKYAKDILNSINELDYFVLVSDELKKFYSKRTNTKCIYIPNSIDEIPNEMSKLYDLNICSVGKLSEEKGFSDLIDVFELVVKKIPQTKLNIIGDGILMQELKNEVALKNLENNVIFHGYQKKEYVNNILLNTSIYVMTSFYESFGIDLLEAFSYGIPCVAFDSASGAKELIDNDENGYLIKKRNKEEMANKIIYLLSNYNIRLKMQKKAIKTAKNYNSKTIMKQWNKLINLKKM